MQKTILSFLAVVCFTTAQAQTSKSSSADVPFVKGQNVLSVGLGLGGSYGIPIGIAFEHAITSKIGVGGLINYGSKSYSFLTDKYRVSNFLIGARGNYHFYTKDKIDAYGGITLGYNVASVKWPSSWGNTMPKPSYGGIFWAGQVGARYYFKPTLAVYGEVGYGLGYLNIGIAKKL